MTYAPTHGQMAFRLHSSATDQQRAHWPSQPSAADSRRLIGLLVLQLLVAHRAEAFSIDLNEPAEGLAEWISGEPMPSSHDRLAPAEPIADVRLQQPVGGGGGGGDGGSERADRIGQRLWKRARRTVPDYFSFEQFLKKFPRNYDQAEACLRRSIFMRKVLEIFKARVEYRLGRKSYKEATNEFSDQTKSEFRLMFQPAPPPEFSNNRRRAEGDEGSARAKTAAGAAAGNDQERINLILRERNNLLKDERQLQMEFLNEIPSRSCANPADESELASRELDKFIEEERRKLAGERNGDQLERLMDLAIREELSGATFETLSRAAPGEKGRMNRPLPWPGQLRVGGQSGQPGAELGGNECDQSSRPYEPVQLINKLAQQQQQQQQLANLDWSQHECFHEIYQQKPRCGNCYVFATTSLAEFYACSDCGPEGKPTGRKFSKRYVMDCGQKFAPTIMGCAGGSPFDTLRFMEIAGVNNIRAWGSLRASRLLQLAGAHLNPLDVSCPLDPLESPFEQWGNIRLDITPRLVHPNDWMEALEDGPLVATVRMPAVGVDSYAGGVHDGQGCEASQNFHTMLLVGYGLSERQQPYWRFRNSFGPNWGDAGHFNLAMDVPGACMVGGVRVYRRRGPS